MNILVTGANGQLGNEIRLLSKTSPHDFVFADISLREGGDTVFLDIRDEDAVRSIAAEHGIDCIINCAAYTDVERAETDVELCRALNTEAPGILSRVISERNGLLIHISTDYVFGGDPYNKPCREDQKGTPVGVYGRTKLEGERRVMETGCKHVILRTAWLYSEYGRNFVKTILRLTEEKPGIKVVFDQAGTPTYALDLASAIIQVISDYEKEMAASSYSKGGIYHYSNEGVCSWYDFARQIAALAGHAGCRIEPCHSDEFPGKVERPSYSVLDKTKIKSVFGVEIPYWTESLRKCMSNMGVCK